jgi:hypothetical protein
MRFSGDQARPVWPPRAGHFRLRLCKGGWQVPAKIQYSPIEGWRAIVDEFQHPWHDLPEYAPRLAGVWHHGLIITIDEYAWCMAVKRWAERECPEHPSLNPRKPIGRMNLTPFRPSKQRSTT